MHFPTDRLNDVFLDVKAVLINKPSLLISVSFINKCKPDKIFKHNLSPDAQNLLKICGSFNEELLEDHFEFSSPLTVDVFIGLLHGSCTGLQDERDRVLSLHYTSEKEIKKRQTSDHLYGYSG